MQRSRSGSLAIAAALAFLTLPVALPAADIQDSCANCHGKDGASTNSDIPVIGGISAVQFSDSLNAYKANERFCPETEIRAGDKKGTKTTMCAVVKDLTPADITALAKYFSEKKFVRAVQTVNAGLAAKGKDIHDTYCEKCHSDGGSSKEDDAGILAGQWMPYLTAQFAAIQSGKRQMPKKMMEKVKQLQPADFDALVNYYGSFK